MYIVYLANYATYMTSPVLPTLNISCGLKQDNERGLSSVFSESRHVAFVKVHKTGSTTIQNVIQRFGLCRNLSFVLPVKGDHVFNDYGRIRHDDLLFYKGSKRKFEILCNHVVYNKEDFVSILPLDTKYISMIRNPFDQFISAYEFYYYDKRLVYKYLVPSNISMFLEHPSFYEFWFTGYSYTNNRMSFDLGLLAKDFHSQDVIDDFLFRLENDFELIMIMEHMNESLLLLRRRLGWKLTDVLYIPKNVNKRKSSHNEFTESDRVKHQKWGTADYALYAHFSKLFWSLVRKEDDFLLELHQFKLLLTLVRDFCQENSTASIETLEIAPSMWNEPAHITKQYCTLLHLTEIQFVNSLRERQCM